ncbi:MAG: IspD/TarI family cytidylyltransferase, partial [Enterobacteriaceae bacterium]
MNDNTQYSGDIVAIVSAAGMGSRMRAVRSTQNAQSIQSAQSKQYITIGARTLLEHAIAALLKNPRIRHVVVVLHPQDNTFSQLPIADDKRISTVVGGEQRADSVLAGLQHPQVQQSEWVLVHDGVRPCLHQEDLQQLLQIIDHSPVGGILAVRVRDTIKRSGQEGSAIEQTVDRSNLWHAQTPQLFKRELLLACF